MKILQDIKIINVNCQLMKCRRQFHSYGILSLHHLINLITIIIYYYLIKKKICESILRKTYHMIEAVHDSDASLIAQTLDYLFAYYKCFSFDKYYSLDSFVFSDFRIFLFFVREYVIKILVVNCETPVIIIFLD